MRKAAKSEPVRSGLGSRRAGTTRLPKSELALCRVPCGARIFQRLYTRLGCQGRPPQFVVEFYPYAGLAHTVRLSEDVATVRISDALHGAPLAVLEAVAAILLARLYRGRAPQELVGTYRRYIMAPRTRRRIRALRAARGRRVETGPRGTTHDLAPMFTRLNRRYFGGRLHRPRLNWSMRAWRVQFGCFDPALDQIVLSRRLDRPTVPAFAVEYVLFHEMLHVKHPLRAARCGIEAHSRKFREEEKRYINYDRARKYLDHLP